MLAGRRLLKEYDAEKRPVEKGNHRLVSDSFGSHINHAIRMLPLERGISFHFFSPKLNLHSYKPVNERLRIRKTTKRPLAIHCTRQYDLTS
jgi:hypothetical protein